MKSNYYYIESQVYNDYNILYLIYFICLHGTLNICYDRVN